MATTRCWEMGMGGFLYFRVSGKIFDVSHRNLLICFRVRLRCRYLWFRGLYVSALVLVFGLLETLYWWGKSLLFHIWMSLVESFGLGLLGAALRSIARSPRGFTILFGPARRPRGGLGWLRRGIGLRVRRKGCRGNGRIDCRVALRRGGFVEE